LIRDQVSETWPEKGQSVNPEPE